MLDKSVSEIVNDVRICLDEQGLNDSESDSEATVPTDDDELDTLITSKIEDALTFVFENADYALLEPSARYSTFTATERIGDSDLYKAVINLPTNFVRLISANIKGWAKYLSQEDLILWSDPAYAMLSDEYTTGTGNRPKAALILGIASTGEETKVLELYTGAKGDACEVVTLNKPALDSSTSKYSIPDFVYRACVYYIAGLTLTSLRQATAAQLLFSQANDLIGITQKAAQVQQLQAQEAEQQ